MLKSIAIASFSSLTVASLTSAATIYPANDGFERPTVSDFQVGYAGGNPTIAQQGNSGWTFAGGGTGIGTSEKSFNIHAAANKNFVDGTTNTVGQAAIFQGVGSAEQVVDGFVDGTAVINFSIEQRASGGQNSTLAVSLDGILLGSFTTASTTEFVAKSTDPIAVSAGPHTLNFTATGGTGDTSIFLDSVSITNAVPEPASIALLGLGAAGVLSRRRRA